MLPSVTPRLVSVVVVSVRPWVSSSVTVTVSRPPAVNPGMPVTAWSMYAMSFSASPSWPAVTPTVCGVFQFVPSKDSGRVTPVIVTSELLLLGVTVTAPVGWPASAMVYAATLAFAPAGSSCTPNMPMPMPVGPAKTRPRVGATATVCVSRLLAELSAAASTRTASVACRSKLVSSKRSVSVARVSLLLDTEATERPPIVGVVVSVKFDAARLEPKVVPESSSVTLAPSRFVSASAVGAVLAMLAVTGKLTVVLVAAPGVSTRPTSQRPAPTAAAVTAVWWVLMVLNNEPSELRLRALL